MEGCSQTYGRPGEQVNLNAWVDGLNVRDRREQVPWRIVDVEACESVVRWRRECIDCMQITISNGSGIRKERTCVNPRSQTPQAELGGTRDQLNRDRRRLVANIDPLILEAAPK